MGRDLVKKCICVHLFHIGQHFRVSVTHNPRSSSWERVYWLNWSWGSLCTHPEDKETDAVIFIIPSLCL